MSFGLIAAGSGALVLGGLGFATWRLIRTVRKQRKRIRELVNLNSRYHIALKRLKKHLDDSGSIREELEREEETIDSTDDSDLVDRANGLFGVPDDDERAGG